MALTERLAILIDAQGSKAVAEFKKIGSASQTELDKADKASSRTSRALDKLGVDGKAAGNLLAGGLSVGAAAVIGFGMKAVNSASALGEQQAATNEIFGKGADIVEDFAESAATSIGVSERAAHQASNAFGDMFQNVGFSAKQAATLSTGLVQLAGDLASFKDMSTDDVLAKLKSGITGESEPLKALGIFIDEAAVKSKALEMGLGGANRELTVGGKMAARYKLIIEQTSKAQGDAARTSDSLANKQRQVNAQIEDGAASLGRLLTPSVGMFAGETSKALTALDKLSGGGGAGEGLAGLVENTVKSVPGFKALGAAIDLFGQSSGNSVETTELLTEAEAMLGMASGSLASKTKTLAEAQQIAADAAEKHAEAIDEMTAAAMSAISAELAYEGSLDNLQDAIADLTEKQKAHTDAVRDHGPHSAQAKAAAEEMARANLALRGEILDVAEASARMAREQALAAGEEWTATRNAEAQIAALQTLKGQFPGLNAQIDEYIAKLMEIPEVRRTRIEAFYRQRIGGPAGHNPDLTPNGMNIQYAEGGIVTGPQVALIGEAGPEVVLPLSPSKRSRRNQLMMQAGLVPGWANGGIAGVGVGAVHRPMVASIVETVSAASSAPMNHYTIEVNPGIVGMTRAQVEEEIVAAIKRFERSNTASWRS